MATVRQSTPAHSAMIYLAAPLFLIALPLPLPGLWWYSRHQKDHHELKHFIGPELRTWVIRGNTTDSGYSQWLTPGAIWVLLILALCDPRLQDTRMQHSLPPAIDLAIIIDISPSMNADDLAPNRLARLKLEIQDFLRLAPALRTALIVYSAEAYRLLPLSRDKNILGQYMATLTTGLTRRRGSNLGQAIELARQTLASSPPHARGILILSDGDSNAPKAIQAMARRLGQQSMPLFILGIGTTQGAPVPDGSGGLLRDNTGQLLTAQLKRNTLQTLARLSGGRYRDLQSDDSDWQPLLTTMQQQLKAYRLEKHTAAGWPLYPALLAAALLLVFWEGIQKTVPMLCLLALVLPGKPAQAGPLFGQNQEQVAIAAFQMGHWSDAAQAYRALGGYRGALGAAAAYYRAGDWQAASQAFRRALNHAKKNAEKARAAYNLGTTLARLHQWRAASHALKNALFWQPRYPDAQKNLALVEQAMQQHTGTRPSTEARSTRETRFRGQEDQQIKPLPKPSTAPSSQHKMHVALQQWHIEPHPDSGSDSRQGTRYIHDDIQAVVQYRIGRQENARPPLTLDMRPW